MADGLNPHQAEAVAHTTGPLLVFAGAGSGKTRVITYRTARLVEAGVAPERILLVTFTNKAANEMKERLVPLVGSNAAKRIWAGTFHSVSARILRVHASEIRRRRDFAIYDDSDQLTVLKQVLSELQLDKKIWSPQALAEKIQQAKQAALSPSDWPAIDEQSTTFVRVWERYDSWLEGCNALDFEDLILLMMRLAETTRPVGAQIRTLFSHVLVDEFQDTNETQYRLVRALASSRNLAVVGDDDQCIYTWRGANVQNIRLFSTMYPDAKTVKLEQNYRSTKHVVATALALIGKSTTRTPKKLWTANPDGQKVDVIFASTDREEARVVTRSMQLLLKRGAPASQMAVLYRTHAQSRAIEDDLRDFDVPYRIVGGKRFYDRKEVKDCLAYIRLVTNPDSDVDLLRVINVPSRGIGGVTMKRIGEIAASKQMSLWRALPLAEVAPDIGRTARAQIAGFRDAIESFAKGVDDEVERPSDFVRRLIHGVGYRKMWDTEMREAAKENRKADADDAADRISNVDELVNAVASYEKRLSDEGEVGTVRGYMQLVALATEGDDDRRGERVSLMTVHAAKGLEFESVWIVGFEDGRFPGRGADTDPLYLEEERRLAYVAVTRAKKRLMVTHAGQRYVHGQSEASPPSRFLVDFPLDSTERLDVDGWEARQRSEALFGAKDKWA